MPAAQQLGRQRVVAQAAAAVHVGGAGGDREDLHRCCSSITETPSHKDAQSLEYFILPIKISGASSVSPVSVIDAAVLRHALDGTAAVQVIEQVPFVRLIPADLRWSGSARGSAGRRAASARSAPADRLLSLMSVTTRLEPSASGSASGLHRHDADEWEHELAVGQRVSGPSHRMTVGSK